MAVTITGKPSRLHYRPQNFALKLDDDKLEDDVVTFTAQLSVTIKRLTSKI